MNQVPKASVELSPGNKQRMLELISGSCITQVIHAFAELSVADELASGPAPLEQLSKRLNVDSSTLRRLLRAGSAVGLVSLNEQECYIGTPLLELLRGDSPDSMRAYAMAMATPSAAEKNKRSKRLAAISGAITRKTQKMPLFLATRCSR
jgi:hypothetical protein